MLLSFALFLTASLHAQPAATGSIEGRVQNVATDKYLNNARVTIKGTNRVAYTDKYGAFRLSDVPAGPVEVEAFFTGLDPLAVTVNVAAGQTHPVSLDLVSRERYGDAGSSVKMDQYISPVAGMRFFRPFLRGIGGVDVAATGDLPNYATARRRKRKRNGQALLCRVTTDPPAQKKKPGERTRRAEAHHGLSARGALVRDRVLSPR